MRFIFEKLLQRSFKEACFYFGFVHQNDPFGGFKQTLHFLIFFPFKKNFFKAPPFF